MNKSSFLRYQSDEVVYADFHANLHTFITNLGKVGIQPKLAQSLARHSDIRLTFNIYSHVEKGGTNRRDRQASFAEDASNLNGRHSH